MKTTILLATLKKEGLSNTEVLSEFLADRMKKKDIDCEIVRLVDHNIMPGTYSDMGAGDEWPQVLKKILASDVIIFATPVWWGGHSSEMQRVIERLDEIHDEILAGKKSKLEGKIGGIVVTGDSDGAQHIVGNIANFFNAVGVILPPYSSLTVLWDGHAKDKKSGKKELREKYEKEYGETADTMIKKLSAFAEASIDLS